MAEPDNADYRHWLSLRKKTTIFFVIENFLLGIDFSFVFLTLWSYLHEIVKPSHPVQFYSGILLSAHTPSVLFSWLISRAIDRSRNVRLLTFSITFVVVLGNILYALPFSPWLLVIGRFMTGFGSATKSVMYGEIARSYTPEELPRTMSYLGSAQWMGYVMGPCLNFILINIHFKIGSLEVTYLNFPGILMALAFSLLQVMSLFMLSNLSMIYDLKSDRSRNELMREDEFSIIIEDDGNSSLDNERVSLMRTEQDEYNTIRIAQKLLTNIDTCLILILSFFHNYFNCCFLSWLPLIVIEGLSWSVTTLGWINMTIAINTAGPCLLFFIWSISNKQLYWIGVCGQFCFIVAHVMLVLLRYHDKVYALNVSYVVVYCLTYLALGVGEEVFITSMYAQLISSQYQMFAEGIRFGVYRFGAVMGFVVTAFGFKNMLLVSAVHSVLITLNIIVLVLRRSYLKNPTIVIS